MWCAFEIVRGEDGKGNSRLALREGSRQELHSCTEVVIKESHECGEDHVVGKRKAYNPGLRNTSISLLRRRQWVCKIDWEGAEGERWKDEKIPVPEAKGKEGFKNEGVSKAAERQWRWGLGCLQDLQRSLVTGELGGGVRMEPSPLEASLPHLEHSKLPIIHVQ